LLLTKNNTVMKRTNNIANLLSAYFFHALRISVALLSDILFRNYNKNKKIIDRLDRLEDVIYRVEWHLMFVRK